MSETPANVVLPADGTFVDVIDASGVSGTVVLQSKLGFVRVITGDVQPAKGDDRGLILNVHKLVKYSGEPKIWDASTSGNNGSIFVGEAS